MGDGAVALRVVSYNVHGRSGDRDALASVVRTLDPDVVVVQEGPRRFRWRSRCADLAHSFGMVYAGGGLPSLGNVIMTTQRVRVHAVDCLRYPLTPGRHMRGAVLAECEIGRTRFVVAGSHLATDPVERPAQARRLKDAMDAANAPLIFAGDLNDTADGQAWRVLADGLVDAAGDEDQPTYSVASPRRRIDVIFADPRWTATRYEVVDSPAVRAASDHFPIVADLSLRLDATAGVDG
jgi:endonuclease/exonuclease/phosphatase family metal-dependent hydrolase